jgi:hypothetical protein
MTSSRLIWPMCLSVLTKGIHNRRVSSCQLYPNCKCRDATTNGNTSLYWGREYKISCSWAEILFPYVLLLGVVCLTWYELAMDPARELPFCGKFCTKSDVHEEERACDYIIVRGRKQEPYRTGESASRRSWLPMSALFVICGLERTETSQRTHSVPKYPRTLLSTSLSLARLAFRLSSTGEMWALQCFRHEE